MKKSLAATLFIILTLTSCAAPEDAGASGYSETTVSSASATPTPTRVEPQTLEEAILAAKQEYTDGLEALHALSNLRRFAEKEVRPVLPTAEWREIQLFEFNTEIGFTGERMTDREFHVASQKYAVMVEEAALAAGLIE
ncbi:hypothetical protein [Arthrobacter caoxuetaonis]|uniref:Uncharacterized protein n=1 Tax=Arthrobacter caoxuetaonis TaxID=2886935 RepID=A0A9X1SDQ4_9MICC|nr:hypothetical protein [Arthrobacter caoxuetaonis]MCC3299428.1 hypothetical protein [Arthrobacter caoxuetaonis]USQ59079.1 hypothetical protein NF551_18410 [Arthrobacter caoxuetaonis]